MSDYRLLLGDCLEVMRGMDADSVDAIVCDPPYALTNRVPDEVRCSGCGWVPGGSFGSGKPGNACTKCGAELTRTRNYRGKGFMGKDWDTGRVVFEPEVWAEMLRIARPGAHLLAFGGDRTHHRMMCAIEDAGWELRTALYWCFGSGFPKSHDVSKAIDRMAGAEREVIGLDPHSANRSSNLGYGANLPPEGERFLTAPATDAAKQWLGWGSALKPAVEIIVMARKPLSEPTIAANCLRWGTGAINIDATRIPSNGEAVEQGRGGRNVRDTGIYGRINGQEMQEFTTQGRWPANLILDDAAAQLLDEMSGLRKSGGRIGTTYNGQGAFSTSPRPSQAGKPCNDFEPSTGGASRFFLRVAPDADDEPLRMAYISKASKRDRDEGLEGMPEQDMHLSGGRKVNTSKGDGTGLRENLPRKNGHPCVKPTALMRWLVRLVTPPGGTILDPFAGSGSTLKAAILEGFDCVGIELDEEYLAIARARIEHALAGALRARRLELAAAQMPLFAEGIL